MARFRDVLVYPYGGPPIEWWGAMDSSPAKDAFARTARAVTELYSELVPALGFEGPRSALRISCGVNRSREVEDVELHIPNEKPTGYPDEQAFVHVPAIFAEADAATRSTITLEVVHTATLRLAEMRGWDASALEACRRHVVDRDFVFTWSGPWKSSRDRRHQARPSFRLTPDDGLGRARLDVRPRGALDAVWSGEEGVLAGGLRPFKRSAATLTWTTNEEVSMRLIPVPTGPRRPQISGTRDGAGWRFGTNADIPVRTLTGRPLDPAEVPRIVVT